MSKFYPGKSECSIINRRGLVLALLFITALVGGIRFSDGTVLLAVARGATRSHEIFNSLTSQYIWDSPLKIMLLRVLPGNLMSIVLSFGFISILPALFFLSKDKLLRWIAFCGLFLTPAFKICLQNMGVGDGLTVVFLILLSYFETPFYVALSAFIIGIWHPQQAFFVGISFGLANVVYPNAIDWRKITTAFGALGLAAITYMLWTIYLPFDYQGRVAFMTSRMPEMFYRNVTFAPLAFLPMSLWYFFYGKNTKRFGLLLFVWLVILAFVSLSTADVTRVVTITGLPVVLEWSKTFREESKVILSRRVVFVTILVAFWPPFSWSGLDYFLWTDLITDWYDWGNDPASLFRTPRTY